MPTSQVSTSRHDSRHNYIFFPRPILSAFLAFLFIFMEDASDEWCQYPSFSTVAQKCHGNFNFVHGNFNFRTAILISPRQFQLRSRQFQFHHGNFNFTTAISTSFTAISTSSRQFQFHHGNFNFITAISISSWQFQLCHGNFNFIFSRLTFPFPYLVLRVFLAI